jgi:hypothetical protein
VNRKRCSRLWQAEAVLDGVLSRADFASFERHAATCADCAAERAALTQLGKTAQRLPSMTVTPLRRRALRNELLRRANELSVGARPRLSSRLRPWAALAAAVGAVLLLFLRFSADGTRSDAGIAPAFEVSAAPNSRWHVARPGRSLRLALELGTLTISVGKLEREQRFSVKLPDGEVEVRGTRFIVECDAMHTRRVVVEEGRVALRLAGQPELSLGPGEGWPPLSARSPAALPPAPASAAPSAERVTSGTAPSSAVRPLAAAGRQTGPRARAEPAAARSASTASVPSAEASAAAATRSAAARDFAEAMAVFSRGDYGSAERLFRAFEERYPSSPHREDLLFLRALGRSRSGDASGARVLSRDYLNRYPNGFRVREARELAREPERRKELGANPGLVTFP